MKIKIAGAFVTVASLIVIFLGGGGTGGCALTTANVAGGPDPWGGCWPGATTTGVPSGTSLTVPGGLNGDNNLVVTTNGAVIDHINLTGLSGEGGILVRASNVTIKNSKVRFVNMDDASATSDTAHPTVIQDTEIDCQQGSGSGISTAFVYGNYTLLRVNVHDCENGLDMSAGHVAISDSWWHNLYMCPTSDCLPESTAPHSGVIQGDPGVSSTVQHNFMEAINESVCTAYNPANDFTGIGDGHCNASGVIGWNNQGSGSNNVLIKRNALRGGGTTIRCPQLPSTNFHVTENLMWPEFNDPALHGTGLSDDCAPFDDGDNRNGATNAILTLS